jgi:hypothetical protein
MAADGGLKFDLTRFDPAYFERLAERVETAGRRGFWVSVMLFQGWSLHDNGEGNPWPRHPWHRDNNVHGIDGDPDRRGDGVGLHTLRQPALLRLQEAYVEKVADTVGHFGCVLYEIANESPGSSHDWQCHLVRHLREHERARGRRHPIGMTSRRPGAAHPRPEPLLDPSLPGGR